MNSVRNVKLMAVVLVIAVSCQKEETSELLNSKGYVLE